MCQIPFKEIIEFWFLSCEKNTEYLPAAAKQWFSGGDTFDTAIKDRFAYLFEPIAARFAESPGMEESCSMQESLTLILLFDQFSRNCFRKSATAFAFDDLALRLLDSLEQRELAHKLHPIQQVFVYMPLQHAESLARQRQGVDVFQRLAKVTKGAYKPYVESSAQYAREHMEIIQRFGRFPHRNEVLGRETAPAEREYLEGGAKRYGQ